MPKYLGAIANGTYYGYLRKSGGSYVAALGATPTAITDDVVLVGQNTSFHIYRTYLSFPTNSIPGNAVIVRAFISMKVRDKRANTEFTLNGNTRNWGYPLNASAWTSNPAAIFSKPSSEIPSSGSFYVMVPVGSVNKGDTTKYELWSNREGIEPTENEYVSISYFLGGVLDSPILDVTYSLPPELPINLRPANGAVFDANASQQFTATYSYGTSNDPMGAYQIQVYNNDTSVLIRDTGWVATSQADLVHTFIAGVFTNTANYKWRARTRNVYGAEGAWSDYSVFSCKEAPSVNILSPTNDQAMTSQIVNGLHSYGSAGSFTQSKYRYVFKQGNIIVHDSGDINGDGNSYSTTLSNGIYALEVTAWDTNNISNTDIINFAITGTPPKQPTITATYNNGDPYATITVTNPVDWKVSTTTPIFSGTGNGTITMPVGTDGTSETAAWEAVYNNSTGKFDISLRYFDVEIYQNVGSATLGTTFTYNGVSFKITQGSTVFVGGDKFSWSVYAHKVAYTRLRRRRPYLYKGVTDYDMLAAYPSTPSDPNWNPKCDLNGDGEVDIMDIQIFAANDTPASEFVIVKNNLIPGESWIDYTISSRDFYEYGAVAVDVFGNISEEVRSNTFYCNLKSYWVMDLTTGVMFNMKGNDRLNTMASEREREEHKGQTAKYPSVEYSTDKFYRGSFDFILTLTEDDIDNGVRMSDKLKEFRDLVDGDVKRPLLLKTFSGDVYYCDIYNLSWGLVNYGDFGREVSFEIVEVGGVEDVFA